MKKTDQQIEVIEKWAVQRSYYDNGQRGFCVFLYKSAESTHKRLEDCDEYTDVFNTFSEASKFLTDCKNS